jgi:hypothetical protein
MKTPFFPSLKSRDMPPPADPRPCDPDDTDAGAAPRAGSNAPLSPVTL